MLANISAHEKALELTLPASNHYHLPSQHGEMASGQNIEYSQSVVSSLLALGFRDKSLVQTVRLPHALVLLVLYP
jgi:hypothetical protein